MVSLQVVHGRVNASIVRLSRRDAHQQGLQCFVTTELLEQEADVVDEVQVIGKVRPDVVELRGCTLSLPGTNRLEDGDQCSLGC